MLGKTVKTLNKLNLFNIEIKTIIIIIKNVSCLINLKIKVGNTKYRGFARTSMFFRLSYGKIIDWKIYVFYNEPIIRDLIRNCK